MSASTVRPLTPERLAIHTMTTKPLTLAEACEAYAARGVAGVCPWVEHVEPLGALEASRIIQGSGLRVPSLVRGGFFVAGNEADRRSAIDRTRALIDDAAVLGAEMLVIVAGAEPGIDLPAARGMVCDGLADIVEHAVGAGIALALEPLHPMYAADRSCVNTIASAREICDAVGNAVLGVAVDVYHVWWDPDLEDQIRRLGEEQRLLGFHICDYKTDTRDLLLDRGMMGEGVIAIAGIRAEVEAAGCAGLAEVEIFSERYWAMDQAQLLDLVIDSAARSA